VVNHPAIVIEARVRDGLDRRLRWLFGTAAAAFGALGAAVVLALTGRVGHVLTIPPHALPWALFAVGYSTTVAVLAFKIAQAPRRQTFLMPVLSVGLVASGTTALGLWAVQEPTGAPARALSNGGTFDLLVALLFLAAWMRLWLADVPGEARERRDEALLAAVLDTLVPAGGAVEMGASDPAVRERIVARRSAGRTEAKIRLELRLLDLATRLLARESLVDASPDTRSEVLDRLCGSRVAVVRRTALAWRDAVLTSYYGDERVLDAVGFDRAYLERRLAEGPNREAHGSRLVAGRKAIGSPAATAMQEPTPEAPAPVLRLVRTRGTTTA